MAIIHIYKCTNCKSENIIKNGKRPDGQQKYHCKDCGIYRTLNPKVWYTEDKKQEIIRAYKERSSMRGIKRIYGTAVQTLSGWLKKRSSETS